MAETRRELSIVPVAQLPQGAGEVLQAQGVDITCML